jgi:hypothetical protein
MQQNKNLEVTKRLGKFYVTSYLLRENPDAMFEIMKYMVVVRAEARFDTDTVDYIAYSPLFELKEEDQETPRYSIVLDWNDGCKVTATKHER